MAGEAHRKGCKMDAKPMETQMDGLTPVTVGQIRRAREEMTDQPSTLVLSKGRMIGKRALDDIKKKPVFLSVPAGRTVAIAKHSWVEVFDNEGHACRFYAEKKGTITGPCLMRTGPIAPEEVPSCVQGARDEWRLLGAAGVTARFLPALGVLAVLGFAVDPTNLLWLFGILASSLLLAFGLAFFLYWTVTYGMSQRVVCGVRPHNSIAPAAEGEGVARGDAVVARPGDAQDTAGSPEGERGMDAPKAE